MMTSLQPHLSTLYSALSPRPSSQEKISQVVRETLVKVGHATPGEGPVPKGPQSDIRRSQWEMVLRNDIYDTVMTEGQALKNPKTRFYDDICEKLDVIVAFTEFDITDQTFPFQILQDLFESLTIPSCSHIFSYLESRSAVLTANMVPQKGKALVLLRTLNDLLRRLSKTGDRTILCGRILTFLSGVFPLGERSGVNLRGEYGPVWEGVKDPREEKEGQGEDEEMKDASDANAMDVDSQGNKTSKSQDPKADFYNTFWALQLPFSKPSVFATTETFVQFKEAVNKVLPVIKEATAKDRAMMGSRSASTNAPSTTPVPTSSQGGNASTNGANGSAGAKRKRDSSSSEGGRDNSSSETNLADYFFAKFLTSPDLIELEIADTHFRRQFLLQLLILLNHLLSFTPEAKAQWCGPRNRSLQMDFTLVDESSAASSSAPAAPGAPATTAPPAITGATGDLTWVKETINKVMDEMRSTMPNGRVFAEVVSAVMERERNWVKWKADLCVGFDKEPAYVEVEEQGLGDAEVKKRKVSLFEATKEERRKMMSGEKDPEPWPYSLGTEPLTEIWELGYRGLDYLEMPFSPGTNRDFLSRLKREDVMIDRRKGLLAAQEKQRAAMRAEAEAAAERERVAAEKAAAEKAEAEKAKVDGDVVMENASEVPKITVQAPGEAAEGQASSTAQPAPLHPSLPAKPGSMAPSASPAPAIASPLPTLATAAAPTPAVKASSSPAPAPTPKPTLPKDPLIEKYEENKSRISWLGLRAAREVHLQHFGKIGLGDIAALQKVIDEEEERKARDGDDRAEPAEVKGEEQKEEAPVKEEAKQEQDVKMQDSQETLKDEHSQATEPSLDAPMEGVSSTTKAS